MLEESTNNDLPTSQDGGAFDQPELTAHYHVVELGYGAGIITFSGPEETRHHKLLLNVVRDPNELYYLSAAFFVPKTHPLWASLLRSSSPPIHFVHCLYICFFCVVVVQKKMGCAPGAKRAFVRGR